VILYFGQFLKITKIAEIVWLLFSHGKSYELIWAKSGNGYILGDCFYKLIWSPCSHRFFACKKHHFKNVSQQRTEKYEVCTTNAQF
jgi:hypothetical protein